MFVAVTAVIACLVTIFAAKRTVRVRSAAPFGRHMMCALLGFPAVALSVFAIATVIALAGGTRPAEPGPGAGMAVFAFVFFLFYALVIGAVVAVPTAAITLRRLRR